MKPVLFLLGLSGVGAAVSVPIAGFFSKESEIDVLFNSLKEKITEFSKKYPSKETSNSTEIEVKKEKTSKATFKTWLEILEELIKIEVLIKWKDDYKEKMEFIDNSLKELKNLVTEKQSIVEDIYKDLKKLVQLIKESGWDKNSTKDTPYEIELKEILKTIN